MKLFLILYDLLLFMFTCSLLETCDLEENLEYITEYLAVAVFHLYQVLKIL